MGEKVKDQLHKICELKIFPLQTPKSKRCYMPWILKKKFIACKKCVKQCPSDAISMSKDKAVIDDSTCIFCGKCMKVCPVHAILKDRDKVKVDVESNIKSFLKKNEKAQWFCYKKPHSEKGIETA